MGRDGLILWAKACGIFYCLHEEAITLAGEHRRTPQAGVPARPYIGIPP